MIQALIVDDEPLHIQGLIRHIDWSRLGYSTPMIAETGEEALDLLANNTFDVLITDVTMPGMSGIELLARCTEFSHLKSLQVLVISGYDEFEFVQEAINYGAKAYVLKPIQKEKVEDKLEEFRQVIEKRMQLEQEMDTLREKVVGSLDVLYDRFVNDMIEGRMNEEGLTESWSKLLDLPNCSWRTQLFVFSYDRLHHISKQDAKQRIILSDGLVKAVKIAMSGMKNVYVGRTSSEETVCIHVNTSPADRVSAEKQITFVQDVVREQHEESITVGVSRECQKQEEVPLLYKEVKHMIMNARNNGESQVLYFDSNSAEEYLEFQIREENIPLIVGLLEKGEDASAIHACSHAFDLVIAGKTQTFTYVQAFGMALISELARKSKHKNTNDSDNEANIRMWQRLIDSTNVTEVKEIVLENLIRYAKIAKTEIVMQHTLISKIAQYIENHLHEQITVKQLAELFSLNASYLSVLFKKETGITLTDFLQESRVTKAKSLLEDRSVKVYEVAEKVGFQTSSYFTYIFKKVTGKTPHEYRSYEEQ